MEQSLAVDWFLTGESSLRGGDAACAVDDFRNAMVFSRENSLFRLRLAQSLIAAGRPDEARPHLRNLWERQPADGTMNLALARLEAARGNAVEASRYYQGAIYGVRPQNPEKHRLDAHFEMCVFLLAHGLKTEARARLIELSAQLPRDPALRARVGRMLMRAGDGVRALQEFQQALRVNTGLIEALRGAGHAAFRMAHCRDALRYLSKAASRDPADVETVRQLETRRQVLAMDPLAPRISNPERARRTIRVFEEAVTRGEACTARRFPFVGPRLDPAFGELRAT
jgi:predicted Zn-dependent protease